MSERLLATIFLIIFSACCVGLLAYTGVVVWRQTAIETAASKTQRDQVEEKKKQLEELNAGGGFGVE